MKGKVVLTGAGPGDPELLSVKALRKIREADVVVYDRLINTQLLNECSQSCEKIYVGKLPNHHPVPQQEIEQLLVQHAAAGKLVVRLKSGDPYVFGRGGEEGQQLRSQGIPFEVIPGISSAIGGLAYGGIPITHRDYASSFHVITGHLKAASQELDWETLAKLQGTLVFLMGMGELPDIVQQLIHHGKSQQTPVAIIQWASRKQQRGVTATLETICEAAAKKQLAAPSVIVVGDVVNLQQELNFFEELPLFGTTIALPKTNRRQLYHQLIDLGAEVLEFPAGAKQPGKAISLNQAFDQLLFLDSDACDFFIAEMMKQQLDWRSFAATHIMAVGRQTMEHLQQQGIVVDNWYESVAAVDMTAGLIVGSVSEVSAMKIPQTVQSWGCYEERRFDTAGSIVDQADVCVFPSSKSAKSIIMNMTEAEAAQLKETRCVVMGPMTAEVLSNTGIQAAIAHTPTYEETIATIMKEVHR